MKIHPFARFLTVRLMPLLLLAFGAAAFAQAQADPPARVASLSLIEGSVAFAPPGETEWTDAVLNRPITGGDRLWTDRGGRAELHLGSAVLHVDSQSFLDLTAIDDDVMQASLNEGTVNARVRELRPGENFEIDTPQLAFRAAQPGDYRIDVDPQQGTTRVTVRHGMALVYGASGQAQQLEGAQVVTFAGRDLERVAVQASPMGDGFDRWAADRNRAEDESIAARYIPREVVGYQQLDTYGSWAQDPSYGAVWYPRVTIADWAPYRYGHWEFIVPWGWTWVDDAPWGFAPFHYGRWAMIGSRWAWCPGRIDRRPVYSPALVAFVGGGSGVNFSLSLGSGRGIGWFPLAPGEMWRPAYRASPLYVTNVNRYVVADGRRPRGDYANRHRPAAVTAVSMEDFSRGRPVHRHWQPVSPADLGRVQVQAQPALPRPSRVVEGRPVRSHALPPPPLGVAPAAVQPRGFVQNPGQPRRDFGEGRRPAVGPRPQEQRAQEPPRPLVQEPRVQDRPFQQTPRPQDRLSVTRRSSRSACSGTRRSSSSACNASSNCRCRRSGGPSSSSSGSSSCRSSAITWLRQQQAAQERAMRQQQAAQDQAAAPAASRTGAGPSTAAGGASGAGTGASPPAGAATARTAPGTAAAGRRARAGSRRQRPRAKAGGAGVPRRSSGTTTAQRAARAGRVAATAARVSGGRKASKSVHGLGEGAHQRGGRLVILGRQVDGGSVDLGIVSREFGAGAADDGPIEGMALPLAQSPQGFGLVDHLAHRARVGHQRKGIAGRCCCSHSLNSCRCGFKTTVFVWNPLWQEGGVCNVRGLRYTL